MNRREFVVAALSTVCAPFAVEAQQAGKVYRIGWVGYSSSGENLGIFVQAMSGRGWIQGRTFSVEDRGGGGENEGLGAGGTGRGPPSPDGLGSPRDAGGAAPEKG